MSIGEKRLFLVEPLGFCGGVRHAMELFENISARNPSAPIYVFHELVHNSIVTDELRKRNAIFVENLDDVPQNAIPLFGAHGISSSIEEEAKKRKLDYCDAVCPLVSKLQQTAASVPANLPLILFGDAQHPEVRSVLGRAASKQIFVLERLVDADKLPPLQEALFLCQTTRNHQQVKQLAELLKQRIPHLHDKSKVCDAVARRQEAIAELSSKCELMLVVASPHSSNGQRLLAIAKDKCPRSALVENEDDLNEAMLDGTFSVGVSSATSTPDSAISAIVAKLESFGYARTEYEVKDTHSN